MAKAKGSSSSAGAQTAPSTITDPIDPTTPSKVKGDTEAQLEADAGASPASKLQDESGENSNTSDPSEDDENAHEREEEGEETKEKKKTKMPRLTPQQKL